MAKFARELTFKTEQDEVDTLQSFADALPADSLLRQLISDDLIVWFNTVIEADSVPDIMARLVEADCNQAKAERDLETVKRQATEFHRQSLEMRDESDRTTDALQDQIASLALTERIAVDRLAQVQANMTRLLSVPSLFSEQDRERLDRLEKFVYIDHDRIDTILKDALRPQRRVEALEREVRGLLKKGVV